VKSARLASITCAVALLSAAVAAAQSSRKDAAGKDYPLFNRMEGFHISYYRETGFDRYEFQVEPGKKQAVEGHVYRIIYELSTGDGPLPSGLQIVRNHQNAVRKAGGSVVYEDLRSATTVMRVSRDGKDVWIDLSAPFGHRYDLVIVEQEAMQQEIVANAEAWRKDLASAGHAVVYGIYFDTDKAVIKPESGPALQEIARLLSQDPKLSVYVVGHTDGTGVLDLNLKLSQARAQAVVEALTQQHKIAASRLQAHGVGPLAPVANNDAEEGRAKNRRVEIVKR
jgi:OOP family OmpA-OmpF porin